jgi:hypothetical protein
MTRNSGTEGSASLASIAPRLNEHGRHYSYNTQIREHQHGFLGARIRPGTGAAHVGDLD